MKTVKSTRWTCCASGVLLSSALLSGVFMAGAAQASSLPALPVLATVPVQAQAEWVPAGDVQIAGEQFTKLAPAAQTRAARTFSVPGAALTVQAGDRLLQAGSHQGPVEVSGGILVRLSPGVSAQQLAQDGQLALVFSTPEIAFLKAPAGHNLLPVVAALDSDRRVERVSLDLVSGANLPQ